MAGSLAGITAQFLTYPLDLARAQMAVTDKNTSLREIFVKIYQNEGIIAFYRGITPTILGVIPYAGCSFYFYDTLKNKFASKCNSIIKCEKN